MQRFRELGGWWVVGQGALLAGILIALLGTGEDWGAVARVSGVVMAAAGTVLAVLGLTTLGGNLTPFPAPRSDAALVEKGVYRLARHPVYGGIGLGSAGLGVFDGNFPVVWLSTGLILYLWAKAGHEEQRLIAHFPDYAGYRSRVRRRLIPWLI